MATNAGDFWLKAAIQVGPFAGGAPSDQQVAELLAKQPWGGLDRERRDPVPVGDG